MSISGLARQLRIEVPRACHIVDELDQNKIADVEYFDEDSKQFVRDCSDHFTGMSLKCPEVSLECPYYVTLKNRRMVNEEKIKEYERLKKQNQRRPREVHTDVPKKSPPPSPSPSPAPTPKKKNLPDADAPGLPLGVKGNGKEHSIRDLLSVYDLAYQEQHKSRPVITGQDAKAAQAILKNRAPELAAKMVKSFLGNPPEFYREKGLLGMRHVLSAANTLLARREVSG